MDAVSLETPQENEFIKQRIARGDAIATVTYETLITQSFPISFKVFVSFIKMQRFENWMFPSDVPEMGNLLRGVHEKELTLIVCGTYPDGSVGKS
jgi:hypothetical protein